MPRIVFSRSVVETPFDTQNGLLAGQASVEEEMPRFLNREEGGEVTGAERPEPQTDGISFGNADRWLRSRAGVSIAGVVPVLCALAALSVPVVNKAPAPDVHASKIPQKLVASVVLKPASGMSHATNSAASTRSASGESANDVKNALNIVAGVENRMGYAATLASELQVDQQTASANGAPGEASSKANSGAGQARAETLALLIFRNLPEGATFSTGAAAGPGTWAMAAGDPNQPLDTKAEGLEKPVTAEVEMISATGMSLGSMRMDLAASAAETQNTAEDNEDKEPAKKIADVSANGDDDDEKPAVKKRVHKRKLARKVDEDGEEPQTKHVKPREKVAKVKSKPPESDDSDDDGNSNGKTAEAQPQDVQQEPEKPKGLVSKLFGWMTTKPKDSLDNDTMRSSLGVWQR